MLPYFWMVASAFFFALMTSCGHGAREHFDWQVVALARALLALGFSMLLVWWRGATFVFLRPKTLWWRSLAGSVSMLCSFYAMTHMPVTDFLTLTHMYPVWVALLSWPLLRVRPGSEVWVAIASGVAGVYLIQQPHLERPSFAYQVALFSSFTSALSVIGLHRIKNVDPRAIVVHFSGVSLLFVLATLAVDPRPEGFDFGADYPGWLLLLGVGAFATIGQVLMTKAFAAGSPAKVSVAGLTQVAFGMLMDIVFWGRTFDLLTLGGIVLVMVPTAWLAVRRSEAA